MSKIKLPCKETCCADCENYPAGKCIAASSGYTFCIVANTPQRKKRAACKVISACSDFKRKVKK